MLLIEPFVVCSEWLFLNVFNAKRAPRRSKKELEAAAEQQRWTWEAIAKGDGEAAERPPEIALKIERVNAYHAKVHYDSQRATDASKLLLEMRKKTTDWNSAVEAERTLARLRRAHSEGAMNAQRTLDELRERAVL